MQSLVYFLEKLSLRGFVAIHQVASRQLWLRVGFGAVASGFDGRVVRVSREINCPVVRRVCRGDFSSFSLHEWIELARSGNRRLLLFSKVGCSAWSYQILASVASRNRPFVSISFFHFLGLIE